MHTDVGFALAWGSFPVLTAYVAQTGTLALAPVLGAAAGAFALSAAQRQLSTPARNIRRRAQRVEGSITYSDGRDRAAHRRRRTRAAGAGAARHFLGHHPARRGARGGAPDVTRPHGTGLTGPAPASIFRTPEFQRAFWCRMGLARSDPASSCCWLFALVR